MAKRYLGDRVAGWRSPDADELAPGSGGIVSLDGGTVAAFRDDDGTLHALSPTCTHLGCRVSFNTAERSWDCPCHGSRFDLDGHVLQGPATKDLAPNGSEPKKRFGRTSRGTPDAALDPGQPGGIR